ncbi:E3 ubiquitin-protein ligase TRIM62-like [Chanos chanos]|uniref:E3 ubiquitin-protein ligase TRIM62-like n=1 Tax=Chanos chanos TaxID=29144 RepID=A0A6J2W9R7_CHACN|nr:E3 ubiquitin-protein ligase TRIM62-like [Chanos chanos]
MASALSQHIRCSICLTDFTDPVCLPCEHSFCRECITTHMTVKGKESTCPECRGFFSKKDVRANRLLRNMVEAAKSHLEEHEAMKKRANLTTTAQTAQNNCSPDLMCPKHNEKFKLFCETDQKLVCFICREEDQHRRHKFKTMTDATKIKKEKGNETLDLLFSEDEDLTAILLKQSEAIERTKERSKVLSAQISAQFEEMHQFLREKEEEVKKQLEEKEKKLLEEMEENVSEIEEMLSDGREEQGILLSALETDQCDKFLEWWSEDGQSLVEAIQYERFFRPKAKSLVVISENLFLGQYESHLQFFVWKEMLGVIKPVPHRHILEDKNDPYLKVFPSGRAVQRTSKKGVFGTKKYHSPFACSKESFTHGQHYWEVEVGEKLTWAVGVMEHGEPDTVLAFMSEEGYCIIKDDGEDSTQGAMIDIRDKPRKIGVYMDCDRNKVLYYNADNMSLIGKAECDLNRPHSLCLSHGMYQDGKNSDPLTICWY